MNNKIRPTNKVLKAGFWYTLSNFLVKGLAFITMPIFTRLMSKGDIGMFSNITSWFSILSIITSFEIYSSINLARFDYKEELDQYISSSLILGTLITLLFYIIAIIFRKPLQELLMINYQTLNVIFIYLLFYPAIQAFQIRHQITYEYKPIIKLSISSAIISTLISILAVLVFENKLMARVYSYFIPLTIIALIVYIKLLKTGRNYSHKYWKYALIISFPLIWHLLAGHLLGSADKIMITKIVSAEANSMYSVAYMIAQIASLLWASMNNAWSPWAYKQMEEKNYKNLRNKSKPYTMLYSTIILLIILFAPELLLIMGGQKYIEAKYIMPPVIVGYLFQFVYSLYVNIEFYHKKQKNIAIGTIIAALINIVLNLIFIPIFGYLAAAYTTLIGYMALFIMHFVFVKRLNCAEWYDERFFFTLLCISLCAIPIAILLYNNNIIRYLLLSFITLYIAHVTIKNRTILKTAIVKKDIDNLIRIFTNRKTI